MRKECNLLQSSHLTLAFAMGVSSSFSWLIWHGCAAIAIQVVMVA